MMTDRRPPSLLSRLLLAWSGVHGVGGVGAMEDFADGWTFLKLVEFLSGGDFSVRGMKPPKNSKDTRRKEHNMKICLEFLRKNDLWLPDIDEKNFDRTTAKLCNLVCKVAFHFDIIVPLFSGDPFSTNRQDPRDALLKFINEKLPLSRRVANFGSDWRDGIALGALVNSYSKSLCTDWKDWDPIHREENWTRATFEAENYLTEVHPLVPAALWSTTDPSESCLTLYLAQFISTKLKPNHMHTSSSSSSSLSIGNPEYFHKDADSQLNSNNHYDPRDDLYQLEKTSMDQLFMKIAERLETRSEYSAKKQAGFWQKASQEATKRLKESVKHEEFLEFGHQIGEGVFGKVYLGKLRGNSNSQKIVSIKTLAKTDETKDQRSLLEQFIEEAIIMQNFDQENVHKIVDFVVLGVYPCILLPYLEGRDLMVYVQNNRQRLEPKGSVPLLDYALQISQGMVYLSNLFFVHRNLSLKSCLLDNENVVKIGDFGFTRGILPSGQHHNVSFYKTPVSWTAPEVVNTGHYSIASDMWSFGLLLWELFTYGDTPFSEQSEDITKTAIQTGLRLQQPEAADDQIYELMVSCWDPNPKSRPSFTSLAKNLENQLNLLTFDIQPADYTSTVIGPGFEKHHRLKRTISSDRPSLSLMFAENPGIPTVRNRSETLWLGTRKGGRVNVRTISQSGPDIHSMNNSARRDLKTQSAGITGDMWSNPWKYDSQPDTHPALTHSISWQGGTRAERTSLTTHPESLSLESEHL